MSKTIRIPAGRDPLTVIINGKTYTYRAGWEYTVPDAVAAALANAAALAPQERPSGGGGGEGGALPPVTAADDGKVLGVVDGAWAATDAPSGGGDVLRIPFTLTMDMDAGTITGTTEAVLADALAAKEAGKILIADAALDLGALGKQFFSCVLSGHTGDGASLAGVVPLLSGNGDQLELYTIAWTGDEADGVQVIGRHVAVSS